jgi:hypothetical protein
MNKDIFILCPLANNFHAACRCVLVGFVNFHFGHGGVYSLWHLILPHLLLMSYYGGWNPHTCSFHSLYPSAIVMPLVLINSTRGNERRSGAASAFPGFDNQEQRPLLLS